MDFIDFSDRKNRYIRKTDVGSSYVAKMKQKVAKDTEFYPTSHIAPPHGLLNDPNGLYQDTEGWYHIYYQWFPLGTVHGLKHWYHIKTKDFLHYESFGPRLVPEDEFDEYGCFTGMAFVEEDIHLYYTGIRKAGDNLLPATIHALVQDGEIQKTGIVEDVDLTKTTMNYRDPFVFKRKDKYYMITGAENCQNEGVLLLSQGDSPTNFKAADTIHLMDYPFGYMLECPNYFEDEINGVLIFSPQGIQKVDPYDFQNVFSVVYAVGEPLNVETNTFKHESFYELDKGFDFYAPQIFRDRQGRRILLGWLGNSKCAYPSDEFQWAHMLTIPREVTIYQDRLRQLPLKEVEKLRQYPEKLLSSKDIEHKAFELVVEMKDQLKIILKNKRGEQLVFTGNTAEYCLDRSQTTRLYNEQYGQKRFAVRQVTNSHTLRIFIDHSSIEIFADEGLTVFTGRFFLEGDWTLEVQGSATYYELKKLEIVVKKEY